MKKLLVLAGIVVLAGCQPDLGEVKDSTSKKTVINASRTTADLVALLVPSDRIIGMLEGAATEPYSDNVPNLKLMPVFVPAKGWPKTKPDVVIADAGSPVAALAKKDGITVLEISTPKSIIEVLKIVRQVGDAVESKDVAEETILAFTDRIRSVNIKASGNATPVRVVGTSSPLLLDLIKNAGGKIDPKAKLIIKVSESKGDPKARNVLTLPPKWSTLGGPGFGNGLVLIQSFLSRRR